MTWLGQLINCNEYSHSDVNSGLGGQNGNVWIDGLGGDGVQSENCGLG